MKHAIVIVASLCSGATLGHAQIVWDKGAETSSGVLEQPRESSATGNSASGAPTSQPTKDSSLQELTMLGMAGGISWIPSVVPEKGFQFLVDFAVESDSRANQIDENWLVTSANLYALRFSPLTIRLSANPLLGKLAIPDSYRPWTNRVSPYFQLGVGITGFYAPKMASQVQEIKTTGPYYDRIQDTTITPTNSAAVSGGWYTEWRIGLDYRIMENFGVVLGYRSTTSRIMSALESEGDKYLSSPIEKKSTVSQWGLNLGIVYSL